MVWDSKPEEEKQAWYKYQRDLDSWEEAQPREVRLKRQRYSRMHLEFERAAKQRKELGLPSQAELDVQGLFGPPNMASAAELGVPRAMRRKVSTRMMFSIFLWFNSGTGDQLIPRSNRT